MRRAQGYAVLTDPDANQPVQECDTFQCGHCQYITHVKPFMDPADMGGLCKVCMRLVCSKCVGKECDVFERKLERSEARDRFLRSAGL